MVKFLDRIKNSKMLKGLLVILPFAAVGSEGVEAGQLSQQGRESRSHVRKTRVSKPRVSTRASRARLTRAKRNLSYRNARVARAQRNLARQNSRATRVRALAARKGLSSRQMRQSRRLVARTSTAVRVAERRLSAAQIAAQRAELRVAALVAAPAPAVVVAAAPVAVAAPVVAPVPPAVVAPAPVPPVVVPPAGAMLRAGVGGAAPAPQPPIMPAAGGAMPKAGLGNVPAAPQPPIMPVPGRRAAGGPGQGLAGAPKLAGAGPQPLAAPDAPGGALVIPGPQDPPEVDVALPQRMRIDLKMPAPVVGEAVEEGALPPAGGAAERVELQLPPAPKLVVGPEVEEVLKKIGLQEQPQPKPEIVFGPEVEELQLPPAPKLVFDPEVVEEVGRKPLAQPAPVGKPVAMGNQETQRLFDEKYGRFAAIMKKPAASAHEIIDEGIPFLDALADLKTEERARFTTFVKAVKDIDEVGKLEAELEADPRTKELRLKRKQGSMTPDEEQFLKDLRATLAQKVEKIFPGELYHDIILYKLGTRNKLLENGEASVMYLKRIAERQIKDERRLFTKLPAGAPEAEQVLDGVQVALKDLRGVKSALLEITDLYKDNKPTKVNAKMIKEVDAVIEDNEKFLKRVVGGGADVDMDVPD